MMRDPSDKSEALIICFQNLKGSKVKDLLHTALALRYLKGLPEFGSNQNVADAVGVSGETVRQFLGLLELPSCVQDYLAKGSLGLEHGRRLGQLVKSRPEMVERAAAAMTGMTAMEGRDLTEYLIRNPTASVEESIEALEIAKQVVKKEFRISTVLDEEQYQLLSSHARRRRMRTPELATAIVTEWLEVNDNE